MLTRRQFLTTGGAFSVGFFGLRSLLRRDKPLFTDSNLVCPGYGPLKRDRRKMLDLPEGFRYRLLSWTGQTMDDGLLLPGMADGMAAFPGPDGLVILVRNHELTSSDRLGPFGENHHLFKNIDPKKIYDHGGGKTPACGGTTTLVFDPRSQEVVSQFLSLAGTLRNCAGGLTPWGTWITCEETVHLAGHHEARGEKIWTDKDHGYNFEVPATARMELADPVPLLEMGRFNHEAVAVVPETSIVYQTEDCADSLIYRFLPDVPGQLRAGGRLQALAFRDQDGVDTRNWSLWKSGVPIGKSLPVRWLDLDEPQAPKNDLRYRGHAEGAALFARGEGMWFSEGTVYFACTQGGYRQNGQIFRYTPSPAEGTPGEDQQPGMLELFIEPDDSDLLKNADNLTVAPWGDVIVCEDRGTDVVRLIGVTPKGQLYTLAHNQLRSEFAGATFTPDGSTLLVNIQGQGLTLAITGPWESGLQAESV